MLAVKLYFGLLLLYLNQLNCHSFKRTINEPKTTTSKNQQHKLKYHDVWYEMNDSTILNCSLRVNKDQHVILQFLHRKTQQQCF